MIAVIGFLLIFFMALYWLMSGYGDESEVQVTVNTHCLRCGDECCYAMCEICEAEYREENKI